jgi:hypothetical protein
MDYSSVMVIATLILSGWKLALVVILAVIGGLFVIEKMAEILRIIVTFLVILAAIIFCGIVLIGAAAALLAS